MTVIIQVQSSYYAGDELKQGLTEHQRSVSPEALSAHLPLLHFIMGKSHLSLMHSFYHDAIQGDISKKLILILTALIEVL